MAIAWIAFIPLEQNKLKSHEKLCTNKDLCGIVMSSEKHNTLEFKQFMKSHKMPYNIYVEIESLVKKKDVQIIHKNIQQ